MVEQKPEKLLVGGSSPFLVIYLLKERMAEWFKAAACKVVVVTHRGFKSYSSQLI